jgi:hypothetical protein
MNPGTPDLSFRQARREDAAILASLLHQDELGATREAPETLAPYEEALDEIEEDPNGG